MPIRLFRHAKRACCKRVHELANPAARACCSSGATTPPRHGRTRGLACGRPPGVAHGGAGMAVLAYVE